MGWWWGRSKYGNHIQLPRVTPSLTPQASVVYCLVCFKIFRTASAVLAGIELMHMIRKVQLSAQKVKEHSFAERFYALAAPVRLEPRALGNFTLIFH